ncbi:MAG: 7-cyano-7-deazaguanine synthase QueC [Gammaproteobacteria bacterium]|nr:7-cyano-7-deazaguanine synthase QueC [Gammaproteobacteria bacterium]
MTNHKQAIVLLSGGLDSATTLAIAQSKEFECYALSFSYGQRHSAELVAATKIAKLAKVVEHKVFEIDLATFKGSALTDHKIRVPQDDLISTTGIPVTYVPARNTVFLSIALAWAEVLQVEDIFIGVNAVDYSGYPDCRPEFIQAYECMANLATKAGIEGNKLKIHAPLILLSKADIIKLGNQLDVDYANTVSCYLADELGKACGSCDSCNFRKQGFKDAGITDPTRYAN